MNKTQNNDNKPYDLEERTYNFAKRAFPYFKILPRIIYNIEISKQGVRSSGSIGANFIEANEAFSRKDFLMRVKICRKEAKETVYWLKLSEPVENQGQDKIYLINEATELMKIFGSIIEKSK